MKWRIPLLLIAAALAAWAWGPIGSGGRDARREAERAERESIRARWLAAPKDPGAEGPPRIAGPISRTSGWGRFAPFQALFRFKHRTAPINVTFLASPPLPFPSGRLVGSDAVMVLQTRPYVRAVPAGSFMLAALVETTKYKEGSFDTALAGAIFYSEKPVERWVAGTWNQKRNERDLPNAGCYPVDAGQGLLFDAGAYFRYADFIDDPRQSDALYKMRDEREAFFPMLGFGGAGAIFDPRSDGCYTTYFGLAKDGSVAVVLTDFTYAFTALIPFAYAG